MAFALSVKGDFFGVLLAQEAGINHEFREKRLEILTGIAQQAALTIQNDRLNKDMLGRERLEREYQLAREIQQTFLPGMLPELSGWNMDVRWRTARQVGGDFYDVFELPGGRLGLVSADVSDKGMPAALYMTVTRTLIRASVNELESPARVLEHVNDLLLMNSQNGMFVTTFYGILDPRSGRLIYANAGHNLPLVLRPAMHAAEPLAKGGTVLGALEHIRLEDHSVEIEPGECLLLYTDGVTESFTPEGEAYGEERLIAALAEAAFGSSGELLNQIDITLTEWRAGAPPSDDMTLLALHLLANK
jgi:serine phosphatase RsbU (regulator of sigma subunit)